MIASIAGSVMSLTAILWYLQDFRSDVKKGFIGVNNRIDAITLNIADFREEQEAAHNQSQSAIDDLNIAVGHVAKRTPAEVAKLIRRQMYSGAVTLPTAQSPPASCTGLSGSAFDKCAAEHYKRVNKK